MLQIGMEFLALIFTKSWMMSFYFVKSKISFLICNSAKELNGTIQPTEIIGHLL
jgi:hypothetical protein